LGNVKSYLKEGKNVNKFDELKTQFEEVKRIEDEIKNCHIRITIGRE
jgi:hypothetical protein